MIPIEQAKKHLEEYHEVLSDAIKFQVRKLERTKKHGSEYERKTRNVMHLIKILEIERQSIISSVSMMRNERNGAVVVPKVVKE